MKICYLADGKSIHTQRWCKHFAMLGHDVHLITFRPIEIEGCIVHFIHAGNVDVRGGNYKILFKAGEVRKLIRKINPDILHALYATSYGITGARAKFHPYVVTALGTDVLISPQQSFIYKKLVQYVFKKADWLTAMADHMRQTMIELGANPEKTDTVVFGIDTGIFNATSRTLAHDKFVITSTRNFEQVYNIPLLLNAVQLLKNEITNMEVRLIGDGSQRQQMEEMVGALNLTDVVTFYGRMSQPQIAQHLNQTHVFVSTSLSDGNNVSLNEAMACGAISVVTDIPANRQWINPGVNGFLVPTDKPQELANAIKKVYQSYNKMQAGALEYNMRAITQQADWNENMKKVEQKYFTLHKQWQKK